MKMEFHFTVNLFTANNDVPFHLKHKQMKTKTFSVFLVMAFIMAGCVQKPELIMTVTGPVDAGLMGTTLAHEHILVDFIGADSTGYHRWNRDTVISRVLPYLLEAKAAGVNTLVECTPAYLGRDPVLLKKLSEQSGLYIITNTGYYGAIENKALPEHAYKETADQLADRWIAEWDNGIEDTGIRPGFIKIAIPGDSVLSDLHEKIVRAAARTHLKTGLVINVHIGPSAAAEAVLRILKEEGVEPSAFIWTHAQAASQDAHIKLAGTGTWISLDNVMPDNIALYVSALVNLKNNHLLQQVLISHDAGWYDVINPDSVKYRGYTAIFEQLKPALLNAGFSEKELNQLLVENPARAYAVRRKI
jgi:phosphotriesterase-related protein